MKMLLFMILLFLMSCHNHKERKYMVHTSYGSGWNLSSSNIACDSVKLFNPHHACVYIDGFSTDLYADRILVSSN